MLFNWPSDLRLPSASILLLTSLVSLIFASFSVSVVIVDELVDFSFDLLFSVDHLLFDEIGSLLDLVFEHSKKSSLFLLWWRFLLTPVRLWLPSLRLLGPSLRLLGSSLLKFLRSLSWSGLRSHHLSRLLWNWSRNLSRDFDWLFFNYHLSAWLDFDDNLLNWLRLFNHLLGDLLLLEHIRGRLRGSLILTSTPLTWSLPSTKASIAKPSFTVPTTTSIITSLVLVRVDPVLPLNIHDHSAAGALRIARRAPPSHPIQLPIIAIESPITIPILVVEIALLTSLLPESPPQTTSPLIRQDLRQISSFEKTIQNISPSAFSRLPDLLFQLWDAQLKHSSRRNVLQRDSGLDWPPILPGAVIDIKDLLIDVKTLLRSEQIDELSPLVEHFRPDFFVEQALHILAVELQHHGQAVQIAVRIEHAVLEQVHEPFDAPFDPFDLPLHSFQKYVRIELFEHSEELLSTSEDAALSGPSRVPNERKFCLFS